MKTEDKKTLRLNMEKHTIEYPPGLEKFLPVDEKAIKLLDINDNDIDNNIEKYFNEQRTIKNNIADCYEKMNKQFNDYQENCKKLVEYIKGLNL